LKQVVLSNIPLINTHAVINNMTKRWCAVLAMSLTCVIYSYIVLGTPCWVILTRPGIYKCISTAYMLLLIILVICISCRYPVGILTSVDTLLLISSSNTTLCHILFQPHPSQPTDNPSFSFTFPNLFQYRSFVSISSWMSSLDPCQLRGFLFLTPEDH